MTLYELFEYDALYDRILEGVGVISSINEARTKAKKLALGWCNDEKELHKISVGKDKELWIGESDYGILIKKSKL